MRPQALANLHSNAFAPERGWSTKEFETLLRDPLVDLFSAPGAFMMVRTVAGEAEILTLAVAVGERRKGRAAQLIRDWRDQTTATEAFLEVAVDNDAALALYARHGFKPVGLREAYYARPGDSPADAVLMKLALTHRQTGESAL